MKKSNSLGGNGTLPGSDICSGSSMNPCLSPVPGERYILAQRDVDVCDNL